MPSTESADPIVNRAYVAGVTVVGGAGGYYLHKARKNAMSLQHQGVYPARKQTYNTARLGGGMSKLKNAFSSGWAKLGRFPKILRRGELPAPPVALFRRQE